MVIEIVYTNNPIRPNDKQHNHLPDYVVVDFPHFKLPPYIDPWDKLHPTVTSKTTAYNIFYFNSSPFLTQLFTILLSF